MTRVWVILALLVAAAYSWSLNGVFHFDDSHSVENNLAIRSFENLPQLWTDTRTSSFIPENRVYRPLVYTFYTVCWWIGGGKTWPFHVMKMIMQVFVCVALFLIWRRLWQSPGWFPVQGLRIRPPLFSQSFLVTPYSAALVLAALFAIHPAGAECVVYISATTSLQCAMFYVWAFWHYLVWRDTRDWKRLALSLFLYFASVASKQEGITLVAMVAITEWFLTEGAAKAKFRAAVRAQWPYLGMFVALAAWMYVMHPEEGNESRGYHTWYAYFMTQWRAYLWYMRLWFWPWDLNADHATIEFSQRLDEPLVIQALIGNLLVLWLGWTNRKRFPALLYGILWFYVTISPASSVIKLAEAINEHRMYLAYVGFVGGTFTVLLWLAATCLTPERRAAQAGFALTAVFIGLGIGVYNRNLVWLTSESLWTDTVLKNPTSGRAYNNLALVYLTRGEHAKAVQLLEKCEQYWNTYMYCSLNKGIGLQALGKTPEAETAYLRAYQLNPKSVHSNFHYARFLQDVKKDHAKAAEHFRISIQLTGGRYPAAEINLATALVELKRHGEARDALKRAIELEPDNIQAVFTLGKIELDSGRPSEAAAAYERLLARVPNHLQAWYNLGVARMNMGQYPQAKAALEKTVVLDPKSEQGWFNLAHVNERLKDGIGAVTAARKLASLGPDKPEYQSRLKELERKFGSAGR